jgi:hypothetical protein
VILLGSESIFKKKKKPICFGTVGLLILEII